MPASCAAYNCIARSKKGSGLKFHRFPKNEVMRQKWVMALRRKDYKPSATAVICSNHFKTEDYYVNPYGTKVLKQGAIPSVFNCLLKKKNARKKLITNDTENTPVSAFPNSDMTSAEGSGTFHVEEQCVEEQHVEQQPVEKQPVEKQHVEEQHIEGQHVEEQCVEEQPVEKQRVEEQHAEEQRVEEQPVEGQRVEGQPVEEQPVEKQRVEGQHVEEQCVEKQDVEEQPVERQHIEKQHVEGQPVERQHIEKQHVEEQHIEEQHRIPSTSEASPHNSNKDTITIRNESTPLKSGTNIRKRNRIPVNVGDFKESDLECPVKRRQYWIISQEAIQKYRKTNKYLHCKLSRSNKKITALNDLFLKIL